MTSHSETNDQSIPDDEQDLKSIFSRECPNFASVNLELLISLAAKQRNTVDSRERFSNGSSGNYVLQSKRRMFIMKSLGMLGLCSASIVFALLLSPFSSNTALAQVQESLKKVRSATYTITTISSDDAQTKWKVYLSDQNICRVEQPNGIYLIFDTRNKRLVEVNPNESKARITEGLNVPDGFDVISQLSRSDLKVTQDAHSEEVKIIGSKQAKGFTVKDERGRLNIWIDPTTELPMLMERTSDGNDSSVTERWSDFHYDVPLPSNLFLLETPEGFKFDLIKAPKDGDSKPSDGSQLPSSTHREVPSYGFGSQPARKQ